MKDAYVVLNYTAREREFSSNMNSFLVDYAGMKKGADKAEESRGRVFGMNEEDALMKAVQYLRERLPKEGGGRVKLLIGGHGQYNQRGGIVFGGASGATVGVPNEEIVEDIFKLTQPFSAKGIEWTVKLCVCFAGRPTDDYERAIDGAANVDTSMAAQVAKGLLRKGLRDFTVKAYFTPVSINKATGHLEAVSEVNQQHKFALLRADATAQQRYARGFDFWKPENQDEAMMWSMSCSLAFSQMAARVDVTNVFDMEVYKAFKWEFLQIASQDAPHDAELAASLNRRTGERIIDDILWYRLVQLVCSESGGSPLQKANKVVWTCKGGQLKHQLLARE